MRFFLLNLIVFAQVGFALQKADAAISCLKNSDFGVPQPDISEYNLTQFPEGPKTELSSSDLQTMIPLDMTPTGNALTVAAKIGDRVFQNWFESEAVKNSAFGKTATRIDSAMKAEVVVGKSSTSDKNQNTPSDNAQNQNQTEHKFSFQFQALQALAKLKYEGWTRAAMSFDVRQNQTVIELTEKFFKNKEFFVSQTRTADQQSNLTGVRWSW